MRHAVAFARCAVPVPGDVPRDGTGAAHGLRKAG